MFLSRNIASPMFLCRNINVSVRNTNVSIETFPTKMFLLLKEPRYNEIVNVRDRAEIVAFKNAVLIACMLEIQ